MNELKLKDVNEITIKFGDMNLGLSRSLELLPTNNKKAWPISCFACDRLSTLSAAVAIKIMME